MFIFVWGKDYEHEFKGWTAQECPRCKRVQPFLCEETFQKDQAYFITLATTKIAEAITCDFCGTTLALQDELPCVPDWDPSFGTLQELVESTNPELGRVEKTGEPTDDELLAVLTAARERATMLSKAASGGHWLGALCGALIAGGAAWGLWRLGVRFPSGKLPGQVLLAAVGGLVIGIVIGGILGRRYEARRALQEELRSVIEKHDLDVERLRRLVLDNYSPHRVALAALAALEGI